jgi:hypothetical protein
MNAHVAKELLNELSASLEALEAQSSALLQLLKEKGVITEEQLAPYLEQAGNTSSVRWVAAKVRLERIFQAAEKEEEKAMQSANASEPKKDLKAEQPEQPGGAHKTSEPKAVAKENAQMTTDTPDKTGKPSDQPEEGAA